jgi:hypothetical protein
LICDQAPSRSRYADAGGSRANKAAIEAYPAKPRDPIRENRSGQNSLEDKRLLETKQPREWN